MNFYEKSNMVPLGEEGKSAADNKDATDNKTVLGSGSPDALDPNAKKGVDGGDGQVRHPRMPESDEPMTLAQVESAHGKGYLEKANSIVAEYASPDTKMLLRTDLGNDPTVVHRVLQFSKKAEARVKAFSENQKSSLYNNSPTMVLQDAKRVKQDLTDEFNRMINIDCRQMFINKNDVLDTIG